MRSISATDLRKNLSATLDSVARNHAPVLITREKGEAAVVLISLEEFTTCNGNRHLLCSGANAERLLEAVMELDSGKGTEHELSDQPSTSTS